MIDRIRANADLVVEQLRPLSGFDFAYDSRSVAWLEAYIERLRESGTLDPLTISSLANTLGSYLGECIVRCHNGTWVQREGTWCVQFDAKNAAFPFAKVQKQLERGAEEGIASFFEQIPALFPRRPSQRSESGEYDGR